MFSSEKLHLYYFIYWENSARNNSGVEFHTNAKMIMRAI